MTKQEVLDELEYVRCVVDTVNSEEEVDDFKQTLLEIMDWVKANT